MDEVAIRWNKPGSCEMNPRAGLSRTYRWAQQGDVTLMTRADAATLMLTAPVGAFAYANPTDAEAGAREVEALTAPEPAAPPAPGPEPEAAPVETPAAEPEAPEAPEKAPPEADEPAESTEKVTRRRGKRQAL